MEKEIEKIKLRNKKVECDKAWEISKTRRFLVALFTYLTIWIYFMAIGIKDAWLNAIVPSLAFILSTMSLPSFKRIWKKYFYKAE